MKDRLLHIAQRLESVPPLLARLALGIVFTQSGWGKLQHLDSVIQYFDELHIPLPQIQAPFAAGTEVVCGVLLLLGLLTRLASLPIIPIMIVALATAKKDDISGLGSLLGLSETLFIVLAIYLAVYGAGKIAADHLLFKPTSQS